MAGPTNAGFLEGLVGTLSQGIEQKHVQEEKAKEQRRQDLWKVIQSPDFSDESKQQAWKDLQGLSNPESKKGLKKVEGLFRKLKPPAQQQSPAQQGNGGLMGTGQVPGQQPPGQTQPSPRARAAMQPPGPGDLQPPTPPAAQAVNGSPAQAAGQQSSGPLKPPGGPMTQQQKTQQQIEAEGAQYDAWMERAKKALGPNADPRDLAEFAGSQGQRLPAQKSAARPTALGLLQQAQSMVDDPDASEADKKAGQAYIDAHKKAEAKPSYQAGLARYPGDDEPHVVRVNPKNPSEILDGDTGEPAPKGVKLIDKTVLANKIRSDSYGAFGNYYKAAKGRGLSEEDARAEAGAMVDKEYSTKLSRQEQQIAIDAELSGVPGGAGTAPKAPAAGAPKPSTAPPPPSAPKSTPAASGTPKAPPAADQENITLYLSSILGVAPKVGGKASGVRALRGQEALAKLTGLSPMELSTELAGDKATAKALAQAVEVAGAFGRVQETLKEHGKVLVDAATANGPGNVPLGNRTVQWLQDNLAAHPELTKYTLALNAVQREYARMVSGGVQSRAMLPVSSVEKGEAILRRDATLADIKAAVDQLKIEADTEQKAFGEQIDSLKSKLKGGKIGTATSGQPSPNGKLTPPGGSKVKIWDAASGTFKDQ